MTYTNVRRKDWRRKLDCVKIFLVKYFNSENIPVYGMTFLCTLLSVKLKNNMNNTMLLIYIDTKVGKVP